MRIIIAHNYSPTSFSVISWSLARQLASSGHEVLFFSHQPNPPEADKSVPGLTVVGWPQKRPTGLPSFLYYYKLHRSFKPELVILHFAPQYVAGIAAVLLGCPNRWVYYHTAEEANIADTAQNPVANKLRRARRTLLYRFFHKIICVSEFAKRDIQRFFTVPSKKLETVYNALPDRLSQPSIKPIDGPVQFHLLARLDPCKRVIELTKAFIAFKNETGLDAKLCIAGGGLLKNELLDLIATETDIVYLGELPYEAVDEFIKKAHWMICSSLVETFGMVNAEALMNATPVLANAVGGIPELIVDAETGFLARSLDQQDWVALFVKAYHFVKQQPEPYLKMQQNCREKYLANFTIEKYIDNMQRLISTISPSKKE